MTIITTEQAQKLLDEATPGPWRSDDAAVRLDDKSLIALVYGNGRGSFMSNNRLFAAAPDLARTVIALHAQLADAKAAQAMVVERACLAVSERADWPEDEHGRTEQPELFVRVINAIRAIAPPSGPAMLAELRARAEKAEAERVSEWNKRRDADASRDVARAVCDAMRADRDRLIAANAVLEAKVAGLVEAVKPFDAVGGTLFSKNWNMSDIVFDGGPMRSDCLFFEDFLNLRAALATQEAGT